MDHEIDTVELIIRGHRLHRAALVTSMEALAAAVSMNTAACDVVEARISNRKSDNVDNLIQEIAGSLRVIRLHCGCHRACAEISGLLDRLNDLESRTVALAVRRQREQAA